MPSNKKIKAWIGAMRLRTLPLSLSTIIAGSTLALTNQLFNPLIFTFAILTTVFLQILSNFANDYGDAEKGTDNEFRVGPTRAVQSGIISLKEMKNGLLLMAILAFLSGIFLLYLAFKDHLWLALVFLALGLFAIWAAIRYTAGKNPYGYKAWGDFFVWLFFGIVGVMGTYFLHTKTLSWAAFGMANAIGFLAASVLNMNNIRDIENDRSSGKNTLVVKIGKTKAKIYHMLLVAISFLLIVAVGFFTLSNFELVVLTFVSALPILVSTNALKKDNTNAFNQALKFISLATFAICLTFSLLIVF